MAILWRGCVGLDGTKEAARLVLHPPLVHIGGDVLAATAKHVIDINSGKLARDVGKANVKVDSELVGGVVGLLHDHVRDKLHGHVSGELGYEQHDEDERASNGKPRARKGGLKEVRRDDFLVRKDIKLPHCARG